MQSINWFFVIKSVCAGVIFTCSLITILLAGPVVEGFAFPVLSKFTISRTIALSANETAVYVTFTKHRDCEYLGMAWYRKEGAGAFERVGLRQVPPAGDIPNPTRPLGFQSAGPWNVALPEKEIRTLSYVETFHKCTSLWNTRTVFYP